MFLVLSGFIVLLQEYSLQIRAYFWSELLLINLFLISCCAPCNSIQTLSASILAYAVFLLHLLCCRLLVNGLAMFSVASNISPAIAIVGPFALSAISLFSPLLRFGCKIPSPCLPLGVYDSILHQCLSSAMLDVLTW
jgi:hypothetical protein